jgi:hypothetical protein
MILHARVNLGTVFATQPSRGHINDWLASPGLRAADLMVGENSRVPET